VRHSYELEDIMKDTEVENRIFRATFVQIRCSAKVEEAVGFSSLTAARRDDTI